MAFLQIQNLTKKYQQNVILHDVNLDFPNHGLFFINGSSGSGKTTFLKCLSGITPFDKGSIRIKGKKVLNITKFRNNYVSYIFQDFQLLNYLSSLENAILPLLCKGMKKSKAMKKARPILENLGLKSKEKQLVKNLSGGEKQRVAIARALVDKKRIILCDEITGSLDEKTSISIMNIIQKISQNHLVILVSHDVSLMEKYTKNIFKCNKGTIESCSIEEKDMLDEEKIFKKKNNYDNLITMSLSDLRKGKFRFGLSLISLTLTLSFLFLSLTISNNANLYLENHQTDFLDYNILKVSKTTKIKLDNSSLVMVRETLPTSIEIKEQLPKEKIVIHSSLEGVINPYPLFIQGKDKIDNINFLPISDSFLSFKKERIKGYKLFTSKEDIFINEEAAKIIDVSKPLIMKIERTVDYKDKEEIVSDKLDIKFTFKVVGVIDEFDFFNTPKAYYSVNLMENYLKTIKLDNLSDKTRKDISWYDRLNKYSSQNDDFCTYEKVIEVIDFNQVNSISDSLSKNGFEVSSSSLTIIKEFKQIEKMIQIAFEVFLVILVLISSFLLLLILYSFVISSKQEIGLYEVFGLKRKEVKELFKIKGILIVFISLVLSKVISCYGAIFLCKWLLNNYSIHIDLVLFSIKEFLFLLVIFPFSYLASSFPASFATRVSIEEIIKEE